MHLLGSHLFFGGRLPARTVHAFLRTCANGSNHCVFPLHLGLNLLIGASLREPHISKSSCGFLLSVVRVAYVSLDYNVAQPRRQQTSSIRSANYTFQHEQCSVGEDSEKRRRTSWNVNVYSTRTGSCEVAAYRSRKVAEIL